MQGLMVRLWFATMFCSEGLITPIPLPQTGDLAQGFSTLALVTFGAEPFFL